MFLSRIEIQNFRGIKELTVDFDKKLNVIIGANGQMKTALIDAIRLFYHWGEPNRDLEITKEDFHVDVILGADNAVQALAATRIDIVYTFADLSLAQKGAFYQYLEEKDDGSIVARVHLTYEMKEKGRIFTSYTTGKEENGMRADWDTMHYFHPYYLGALRDSTRDLMTTRNNLLGRVIKRKIDRANTEDEVKSIIKDANDKLLERDEVKDTQKGINDNLDRINKSDLKDVILHIDQTRIEYVVNAIKPFLPFASTNNDLGFVLSQNSLGFNNLIYIASVLSDIKDCHVEDAISIFALLIEEPEAHLHPQLQVNLYEFLRNADDNVNSQTFITTHSPTLTSKIPLENLMLLKDNKSYRVGDCFKDRHSENIIRDAANNKKLTADEVAYFRNMIARYFDVTRSQLLFSKGCLFIEGISECQLIETFSQLIGKSLIGHQIELVNVQGVAFNQFLLLFNSSIDSKRLPLKAAFITDADQFTDSKKPEYALEQLVLNNYEKLNLLRDNINGSTECSRVKNMASMSNAQAGVKICAGMKTLEYQICRANISAKPEETKATWLYELITSLNKDGIDKVDAYMATLGERDMTDDEQQNVAILLWKSLPAKAAFAQCLNMFLLEKIQQGGGCKFSVPAYICDAVNHLIP